MNARHHLPATGSVTRPVPAWLLHRVLLHHAVPALAIVLPWMLLAPPWWERRVPPVLTLLLVAVLVLPVIGLLLTRHALHTEGVRGRRRVTTRLGLARPGRRDLLRVGLPALAATLLLPGLALPMERVMAAWWGGLLPDWWSVEVPDLSVGPPAEALGFVFAWALVPVVIGPVVEEIWFRGLVQPALPGGPITRVVLGSALFAVYHVWQPHTWLTVFLATVPAAWARERTGSTWLAVALHVSANALTAILLFAQVMAR